VRVRKCVTQVTMKPLRSKEESLTGQECNNK